jgi:hypothetical protein
MAHPALCAKSIINAADVDAADTIKTVVSLNARDEVLSAEYHKIRASQGTKVPWLSRGYSQEDDRLNAVCIARLVAC